MDATNVLVTRGANGKLIIAAWNLVDPDKKGSAEGFELQIRGVSSKAAVRVTRADAEHGNTLAAYTRMGRPVYPTRAQVEQLNSLADANTSEKVHLGNEAIQLEVPVNRIALLEVEK